MLNVNTSREPVCHGWFLSIFYAAFTTMQNEEDIPASSPIVNLRVRKTIKGHRGRILHFDWSPDKHHVITAGQVHMSVPYACTCICTVEIVHKLG